MVEVTTSPPPEGGGGGGGELACVVDTCAGAGGVFGAVRSSGGRSPPCPQVVVCVGPQVWAAGEHMALLLMKPQALFRGPCLVGCDF